MSTATDLREAIEEKERELGEVQDDVADLEQTIRNKRTRIDRLERELAGLRDWLKKGGA